MLTAVKRVRGMRLVGAVWKRKEEPQRRLAPAGTRMVATEGARTVIVVSDEAANDRISGAARK
jgi:hypothetical protein